ncbi:hypothetical protein Hanom_Chr10g00959411 [Helianthus anomalus]
MSQLGSRHLKLSFLASFSRASFERATSRDLYEQPYFLLTLSKIKQENNHKKDVLLLSHLTNSFQRIA